ncbi:hypothetical protein [Mycobacterium sp. HUMS_1102779]|uniref:hypothetical protein n=1 Tax=Mycobacterium sp. HUMS_1102779 TaxID=3383487 RepID=UPI00389989BC
MADNSFDVPLPAGALDAEPWQDDTHTHRQFWGTTYIHDAAVQPSKGVRLGIWGLQDISGTVLTRTILIEADRCGTEVDSATGRRIATHVLSLCDELDALSDPDDTIES